MGHARASAGSAVVARLHLQGGQQAGESAAAARARDAFDNAEALIAHPAVDLVVVSVKVPEHHQLVSAAIDACKMVFCEWPLGRTSNEAVDLARRARIAGVRTVVGLQASFAPAIRYLADLIADGYIGEVLSTGRRGCRGLGRS